MVDIEMQAIPINEMLARKQVPVDIFLRLNNDKFILIAKAGASTPTVNLEKYKLKAVLVVYVRIEDYRRLIVTSIRTAHDVSTTKNLAENSRFAVLQEAMVTVYREISDLGFDEEAYNHAKLINHSTLSFVVENPALVELLNKHGSMIKDGNQHSMMVSMIATMIGMGHDWVKPMTLEKLSLGGYLHDIGKTKLPSSILEKRTDRLTRDERIIYEAHCEVGRQMLLQARNVPDDVAAIVFEHHERADGTGFPRQLKDFQINPLARVVNLANVFVEQICQREGPYTNEVARKVFDEIEMSCSGKVNRDAVKVLRKLLTEKGLQAAG
jgi:putative nucleotidyltransferase with HDIG domain